MMPRKSHRVRKTRTIWEQKRARPIAKNSKIKKKTAHIEEKTALKRVITGSLLKEVDFNVDHLPEPSMYKSPLNLKFKHLESLTMGLIEL